MVSQPTDHPQANLLTSRWWCVSSICHLPVVGIPWQNLHFFVPTHLCVWTRALTILGFLVLVLKFGHFSKVASIGCAPFFLATLTITIARLNGKNYSSWSTSVELWYPNQGYHDHLETEINYISDADRSKSGERLTSNYLFLWQSVEIDVSLIRRIQRKFLLMISNIFMIQLKE